MFNFLMKKMMQSQLKGLPQEQQEMIMRAVEKEPKFFQEIAKEIQAKVKSGVDQQTASMTVMMKHKEKLRELMK